VAEDDADARFENLPENMRALLDVVGIAHVTVEDQDEQRIYTLLKEGRCMLCANPVEEDAVFLVARHGIVGIFCAGKCATDMAVLGFLQEAHDEITSAVKFRGSLDADRPEGEVSDE